MKCDIMKTDGPCQWCDKGKQFFAVRCETFTGTVCAVHLDALLGQEKARREDVPNGQPVAQ